MDIINEVLVKRGDRNIGLFSKTISMPAIPPVGTVVGFEQGITSVFIPVARLTFRESDSMYKAHYVLDVDEKCIELEEFLVDSYYPIKLVESCGFSICWMEEEFDDLAAKLSNV